MKIFLVGGARPNFVKIAPVVRELKKRNIRSKERVLSKKTIYYKIIHTGQHYDYEMSKVFFNELEIPQPDYFLNSGSGSHAEQTAKIMAEFERKCLKEKPNIVVVVGDVNSTLACSIASKKLNIKVAHVEAGLRSKDMKMPEEINRIVTDSISDYLFVTEKSAILNLKQEGKKDNQIFFVGNVMIDTLFFQLNKLSNWSSLKSIKPLNENYAVVTLHRPSNVDNKQILSDIIESLSYISEDMPVVFTVHPRTKKNLEEFGLLNVVDGSNIRLLPPLPYMEFLNLWKDSKLVLTDSGGLQEETTALGIPCFTIRENTERPVTIEEGTNMLVGIRKETIISAYNNFKKGAVKKGKIPAFWDGQAASRIVAILLNELGGL